MRYSASRYLACLSKVGLQDTSSMAHRFVRRSAVWTLVVAWTLVTLRCATGQLYAIHDIGTFGGSTSGAYAINANGAVCGWADAANGDTHGFWWATGRLFTAMIDLGSLGNPWNTVAMGLNNNNVVVGTSIDVTRGYGAFYADNTGMHEIKAFGGRNNFALDVNDAGKVVGYANCFTDQCLWAFLYDINTHAFVNMGTLGGPNSQAFAINASGQVTGSADLFGGASHAFRWTDTNHNGHVDPGEMVDLGTLPGRMWSQGNAINDFGQVAGTSNEMAFLWTDTNNNGLADPGEMQYLGSLGGPLSYAYGINSSGQVVGSSSTNYIDPSTQHAFLWVPAVANGTTGQMHDLNNNLPPNSGWVLQQANAINDSGQIVGWGLHNGVMRAFMMAPLRVTSLIIGPSPVAGCKTATGAVYLSDYAPVGGMTIPLASSLPSVASVPASLVIPQGHNSGTFTIFTSPVAANTNVTITAFPGGVTGVLTVRPIGVQSVNLNPVMAKGGSNVTCTVWLECLAAPGPITVTVTSSNPGAALGSATFIIPAGKSSVAFVIQTKPVTSYTPVTITATANGISQNALLQLFP